MVEEEGMSAREAWLKEHEIVQDELSRMKQELMGDLIAKKREADREKAPQLTGNENIKTLLAGKGDSLLSKTTPTDTVKPQTPSTRKANDGEIPKHPELSNFVARVMERENTINRKIFEKGKVDREREALINGPRIEEPESTAPSMPKTPQTDPGGLSPTQDTSVTPPPISEGPIQEDEPKAPARLMPVRRSFPTLSAPVSPPVQPPVEPQLHPVQSQTPPPVQPPLDPRSPPVQSPTPPSVPPPVEPQLHPVQSSPPPPVQPPVEHAPSEPSQPTSSVDPVPDTVATYGTGAGLEMGVTHTRGKVMVRRVIKKRE